MNKLYYHIKKIQLLILIVGAFACINEDEYLINGPKGPKLDEIIRFESLSDVHVPSDSFSNTTIKVAIYSHFDSSLNKITFSTNLGNFNNGQKKIELKANTNGMAQAVLYSAKNPGIVIVSASIKDYIIDTLIEFTPAYPNDFIFSTEETILDTTETLDLEVELHRNKGIPNDNIKINFEVLSLNNQSDGLMIPPFGFSEDQKVVVTLQNPNYVTGNFRIYTIVPITVDDILLIEKKDSIDIIIR